MSKKQIEDDKLCYALLVSPTQEAAAKMLGCGRNYISERKQEADFQEVYRAYKENLITKTTDQLLAYNLDAIQTLHRLLESPNDSVRVCASKAILNYSQSYYLTSDLQKRIEQLEQTTGEDA